MPSVAKLRPRDIAWRRLANQHLIGAPFASPVEVVRRLGAVQSQDYPGGKWGISMRTPGATDADVERDLTAGAIVRTHVLRPTWHFVAAEDIRWMLALTAPRVRRIMASYDRQLGLDEKVFARSARALTKALSGGKQLTRSEIRNVLQRVKIDTRPPRLGHLMMHAELDGLVCSGAMRGKQATYALLEERLTPAPALERDEALGELARRYFPTRGPATVHDFGWWSGLTIGDAKRGVELIQSILEHHVVDGRTYWFTGAPPSKPRTLVAHLLPNYDEYFIGLKDRSAIGELVRSAANVPADAFSAHVVAVDGQLVGGWKRTMTGRTVTVQMRLVVEVTSRQMRSIEVQVKRYGQFLGVSVDLVLANDGIRSTARLRFLEPSFRV
ncbi:MAG: winged helix DNA-binding domain-containing protein [Gemmatimonadaceae bacterium]